MLRKARDNIARAGLENRILLVCADAKNLPFRDGTFSFGYTHSMIHHLTEPLPAIRELVRVIARGSGFMVRDLRRPPGFLLGLYVRVFGCLYTPVMKRIYRESLQAGYTGTEMKRFCDGLESVPCRPRSFFVTHVGIEGTKK